MVAALSRLGIGWAGIALNLVLITAIISTMLAAMFGLGRMIKSLADEGLAPKWLKDEKSVPYRGILFSGFAMLIGLGMGLLLPKVYLFLVSAGGFSLLFVYAAIMATHIRFRKLNGCPPSGKCQLPGYPYTSWIVLISLITIILSMPFISGQSSGLIAGIIMTAIYSMIYAVYKLNQKRNLAYRSLGKSYQIGLITELSEDLTDVIDSEDDDKQ
ncbi:MAG: GABA permease [Firmicutes bacterium ADurb.Bin419]|nr:MAG: GABA permease [Firmicutes bacterium ADurb.Bin419]